MGSLSDSVTDETELCDIPSKGGVVHIYI